jgi:beta-glucosidase
MGVTGITSLLIWQVAQIQTRAELQTVYNTPVGLKHSRPKLAIRNLRLAPWMNRHQTPLQRTDELLAQMGLDDKIAMMHGVRESGYGGVIPGNVRLGIPALKLEDGPAGVGDSMTGVTQLPAPIAAAATWDTSLIQAYGSVIGAEEWAKGANVDLGPTVNIIRDPRWGRAFESLGEDPYLAGKMAAAEITGIQQQGVLAQVKHFAVYNQETGRNTPVDNAMIDERTLHEIYLPQFQAAVDAGVASVMCAYSTINSTYACQHQRLLRHILGGQFGFKGFITSDWGATHSTAAAANAGLSMEMPRPAFFSSALKQAVKTHQVSLATIDASVRRTLFEMFSFGLFDRHQVGSKDALATSPAHSAVARNVSAESTVLLKNRGNILPLRSTSLTSIAVIGQSGDAQPMSSGAGSASVVPSAMVTPFQAIRQRAGSTVRVRYAQGPAPDGALPAVPEQELRPLLGHGNGLRGTYWANPTLSGHSVLVRTDPNIDFHFYGTSPGPRVPARRWSARWKGHIAAPADGTYQFSITSDDGGRLFIDGQLVIDNWYSHGRSTAQGQTYLAAGEHTIRVDYFQLTGDSSVSLGWLPPNQPSLLQRAANLAGNSSVAIVFARDFESEGFDRTSLMLPGIENALISAVVRANPRTIVVLNTGDPVLMPWISDVPGLVEAWYPGQQDGNAIASILFGDTNPSGKLPVTFPANASDLPASSLEQWTGLNGRVLYSEGLNVGYRWYDARKIAPLFPFGYGLSYTTFKYSGLTIRPSKALDGVASVGLTVTNSGARAGSEVVQLYVGDPATAGEPPQQLKGFQKVYLKAGQSRQVEFALGQQDFAHWDTGVHAWSVSPGQYQIGIGSSSRDVRVRGTVTVPSRVVLSRQSTVVSKEARAHLR